MAIVQPSQYQVNNMQQGDIIFVKRKPLLYRLYRKLFTDKPKIKVRQFWTQDDNADYNVYYQEDCTLLYYYEVACVQKYKNEVPIIWGRNEGAITTSTSTLKELQVGLYNAILCFNNGTCLTIPVDYFSNAVRENTLLLKQIEDHRMIDDLLKFQRYKGDYFKSYVEHRHLRCWNAAFCSVCGNPVKFKFSTDVVKIENKCECGELKLDKDEMTYDELSIWYYSQLNPNVKKRCDEYWFKKE